MTGKDFASDPSSAMPTSSQIPTNDTLDASHTNADPLRGFDTDAPPNASLSLLVQMPDGKKRQVEVPPNASVRQLRSSIVANIGDFSLGPENSLADQPPEAWDLRFGDSSLQDEHTLDHYNIPDVVDHANAVLKAIHDSDYPTENKRLEALEGAYNVVVGVSRGERDMARLVNAAIHEGTDNFEPDPTTAQPSIRAMRRSRPSRIPSLNLSQLPPLPTSSAKLGFKDPSSVPSAPTTPRDLLLRLSHSRPDLYKFSDNNKTQTIPLTPTATSEPVITSAPPPAANGSPVLGSIPVDENNNNLHNEDTRAPQAENQPRPSDTENKPHNENQTIHHEGSGELKRGTTWIDYLTTLEKDIGNQESAKLNGDGSSEGEIEKSDSEGNSEDDPMTEDPSLPDNDSPISGQQEISMGSNIKSPNDMKPEPKLDAKDGRTKRGTNTALLRTGSTENEDGSNHKADDEKPSDNSGDSAKSDLPSTSKAANDGSSPKTEHLKQVIGLEPHALSGAPEIKIPKKRGRKRKNPHLTEEQRKQQRQAQNRESAKLSRLRRKNMTMRYERRVNILEVENTNLRDTVSALQKRLEMLQNLLTITVRPSAGHMGGATRGAGAAVGMMPSVGGQGQLGTAAGMGASATGGSATGMPTHPSLGSQPDLGLQPSLPAGHQLTMPHPQLSTQSRLGPQPQLGSSTAFGAGGQRNNHAVVGLPNVSGVAVTAPLTATPAVSQPGLANGNSVATPGRSNPLQNLGYRNY